jgi:putative ABC transport system permease protein
MLKNYFKIAWRNLLKNKTATAINVFGLTVGLVACMLIVVYVVHENSYDIHYTNSPQLYQLATTMIREGKENKTAGSPFIMGETMQQEFPEVQGHTKLLTIFTEDKTLLRYSPGKGAVQTFYEPNGFIGDSAFFNLFSYEFAEGNASEALKNPKSIVLNDEIAKKFFGNEPALNKKITVASNLTGGDVEVTVTGVYKQPNKPSHINARFFLSYKGTAIEDYIKGQGNNYVNNNMFATYLLLKPGADAKKLEAKFPAFLNKYAAEQLKTAGLEKKQFLVHLKDIHLRSGFDNNISPGGNLTYLYILISVALFILLIACINFMNLATARSSKRSAEVGVRKVLGAEKSSLIWQFLGESLLMTMIAFALSLGATKLLVPVFSEIAGKELSFSFLNNAGMIAVFFLLSVITGLLAGSYPAFYLSSFKPIKVLKGKISNTLSVVALRKGLVVFQFVVSVALIVATAVIQKQMVFMRSKDLGFTKEQQIVIPLRSATAKTSYKALKAEISRSKDVQSIGASVYYPGIFNAEDNYFYKEGQSPSMAKTTRTNRIDDNFLQTLNIKLAAGRLFSSSFTADTGRNIILNEKAVNEIGFASAEKSIGEKVLFRFKDETLNYTIVGVVKDFHFEDLQQPITPYAFILNEGTDYNYMIIHGSGKNIKETLAALEKSWKASIPNEPLEYSFLDADFQKNYIAQERLSSLVSYFTIIAILISCLGLFALAAFSAEQRIKEIGVRKVLGASEGSIVALLSRDFLKLVVIAALIAIPIAWYAMNEWLKNFAYRTTMSWIVFAATIGAAIVIALVTISFQAVKAALTNPVKSLRTE